MQRSIPPWARTDFVLGLLLRAGTLRYCLSRWAQSQTPAAATLSLNYSAEMSDAWKPGCVQGPPVKYRSRSETSVPGAQRFLPGAAASRPSACGGRGREAVLEGAEHRQSTTPLCSVRKPGKVQPRKTAPEAEEALGRQARAPLLHVPARQEGEQGTLEEGAALTPESGRSFDVDYRQSNSQLPLPKRERLE